METPNRLLIVDDEEPFRKLIERNLRRAGASVTGVGSGEDALVLLTREEFDVCVLDLTMPGISGIELLRELKELNPTIEAIMITGHGTIETAIEAMKLGAYDYIEKPLKMSELKVLTDKACERRRLTGENKRLRRALERREPPAEIVGQTPPMQHVLRLIDTYADHRSPVLILGESGTGKELAARALHRRSARAEGPFVAINCGALQTSILESELFGHTRGAFTGAVEDRQGLFEHADGGTFFIDEVTEMAPETQTTFLRVLEDSRVRRLGDVKERQVSVRIVAATNKDIEAEVASGRFREDLFYRLNVLPLELPPLRDRIDDLGLLCRHYLKMFGQQHGAPRRLSESALEKLSRYDWPGNVRELFNVLERALIVTTNGTVEASDIAGLVSGARSQRLSPAVSATLEEVERAHILRALDEAGGNKTRAARALGISVRSLYRKLERYGG
ncbi:MAG: sigma-54-dependent transcriptional regulator [Planctomycetota bacterium]